MEQAAHAFRTSSEGALQSQAAVTEDLGGGQLAGSGFEAEEPEVEFEEEV